MKRFLRPTASAANSGGACSHDIDASGGSGGQSSSSRAPEPGGAAGPSSSSCAPEPGGEPGSSGGGGLPGDESLVDLEVSSNSSGETKFSHPFPRPPMMAGNVATNDATELIEPSRLRGF